MSLIDRKTIKNLSELARIELSPEETEKLLHDLEKILVYFEELKGVDTGHVQPMSGGTLFNNVFREDGVGERIPAKKAVHEFPESESGFLKVPPVFE